VDNRYGLNGYGQFGYKGIAPDVETPTTAARSLAFVPNWAGGVQVRFAFRTVLSRTPYGVEQRRPQRDVPQRTITFSVLVQEEAIAELVLFLERLHASTLWCPVFPEAMRITEAGAIMGLTALTPSRDVSDFYALNNLTDYVMLAESGDPSNAEVIELSSVGATLALASAVTLTLNGPAAIVWPAMRGYLRSWKVRDITDGVAEVDIEFYEILLTT
jgi:hypothetical protein